MNDSAGDRITELEISLTHLQRLFEELNQVVIQQASRADRADRQVQQLSQQIRSLKDKADQHPRSLEDEKPPHY